MSMRVVWKYLLQDIDITHEMPYKAQPRAVGIDPATGEIALWCEVDPGQPTARHQFHVRGTGHPLGEVAGRPYIGTHRPPRPVRAPRLRWRRDRPTPGGHGTVKHRHTTQQCGLDCGRDIGNTAYVCVDCADQLRDRVTIKRKTELWGERGLMVTERVPVRQSLRRRGSTHVLGAARQSSRRGPRRASCSRLSA